MNVGEVAGWARPPAALIHQARVRALSLSLSQQTAGSHPSQPPPARSTSQPSEGGREKMLFWPLLAAL